MPCASMSRSRWSSSTSARVPSVPRAVCASGESLSKSTTSGTKQCAWTSTVLIRFPPIDTSRRLPAGAPTCANAAPASPLRNVRRVVIVGRLSWFRFGNPEPLVSSFAEIEAALNAGAERADRLWLADEEVFGELPVAQDLGVNRSALVQVQAQARQILQPQIAVAVDGRVLEPFF